MKSTLKPIWYNEWNRNNKRQYYDPVLLSCKIPFGEKAVDVSITTKPCEIKRYPRFTIKYNGKRKERNFTVCVKPLDFRDDISYHLIQWIEVLKILGADKINFYVKKLRKETLKVLKWFVYTFHNSSVLPDSNLSDVISLHGNEKWNQHHYQCVPHHIGIVCI